jgi:hypothetical protein
MMVLEAKNPRWGEKEHESITIDIRSDQFEGWVTYVARRTDYEAEGVRLWYDTTLGKYGAIADSDEERILRGDIPPPEGYAVQDGEIVDVAGAARNAEAELVRRMEPWLSVEAQARAEIDAAYAAKRKTAIAAILAVKEQAGWPFTVVWPDQPE